MSDFEFVIPLSREDLLRKKSLCHYCVKEILNPRFIYVHLKNAENAFREQKSLMVLKNFDFFYSIIHQIKELDLDISITAYKLIVKVMNCLQKELLVELESTSLTLLSRKLYLNLLKMSLYIFCSLSESLELQCSVLLSSQQANKANKKKTPIKFLEVWEQERDSGLRALLLLVHLQINKLWDPSIVEDDFVSMITNACYKSLENIHQAKYKMARETINNIICLMVKRHNHSFSCVIKSVQMLQQSEHVSSCIAQLLATIYNNSIRDLNNSFINLEAEKDEEEKNEKSSMDFKTNNIINDIVLEISKVNQQDLSQDTISVRSYGNLLVELSRLTPQPLLSSISLLIDMLDGESYTMRNSILSVMGELIVQLLNKPNLEERLFKTKKFFVENLTSHILDINAFVRSRVLQIWSTIITEKTVTLSVMNEIIPLISGRIFDKSSIVRKNALQVLIIFLKNNNVASKLTKKELKKLYENEKKKLDNFEEGKEEEGEDVDFFEEFSKKSEEAREKGDQLKYVIFLKRSYEFLNKIQQSLNNICQLLNSKVTSDVIEAINFFSTGYQAGIKLCKKGIRDMLPLVCSKETEIKSAVVQAYVQIFLSSKNSKPSPYLTAQSLIQLIKTIKTFGDILSLEELIHEFLVSEKIEQEVIKVIWYKLYNLSPEEDEQEVKAIVMILRFIASAQSESIHANLDLLIQKGLKDQYTDYIIAMETLHAISKISFMFRTEDQSPFKLPNSHPLFEAIIKLLTHDMKKLEKRDWMRMSQQAITTIYDIAEKPDLICQRVVKEQTKILNFYVTFSDDFNNDSSKCVSTQPQEPEDEILPSQAIFSSQGLPSQPNSSCSTCPAPLLSRFLSSCGHVALQQFIYLDVNVYSELKRRSRFEKKNKETSDEESERTSKTSDKSSRKSLMNSSVSASFHRTKFQREVSSEDKAVVAEDTEAEFIKKIIEEKLIADGNLLDGLKRIIIKVCSNVYRYNNPHLAATAALALCKFMIISPSFCSEEARLLFTLLEKSPNEIVRSNSVTCLADMVQRFPNILAPWTSNIYNRLRDDSPIVRLNTVFILTKLILSDMIKVKGQISELALCILDKDEEIADASKNFFFEFSKTANSIYNILPDIVSRLSEQTPHSNEETFKPIMKFLISFIEKEKQSESIIEKLCIRMRASEEIQQWQDLSYCFTLLPLNEKCLVKLNENFECYSDKLTDPFVSECFQAVLLNGKKVIKPGDKTCITELEEKFAEQIKKNKGGSVEDDSSNDEDDGKNSKKNINKNSTKIKSQKNQQKKKNRKKIKEENEEEYDLEESDVEDITKTQNPSMSSKSSRSKRGRQLSESSLESNKETRNKSKKRAKKPSIIDSSDEDICFE